MLRCVQTASPENFAAAEIGVGDMSVLERQRSMLQRLFHEQQLQLQRISSFSPSPSPSPSPSSSQTTAMPLPLFQCQSFMNSLPIHPSINENSQNFGFGCSDITTSANASGHSSRSRKRKAGEEGDQFKGKNTEGGETGESESGITVKSEKENSGRNSGENSKEVVQKTEYIHVRARRGQATDSHSLAERARREKISKKMKCLQDLVPGCNKVTGKAGMLDEIINYVQSLQKQVEFLSMKLASLNPRLDFNMDSFFPKEIPAYVGGGFPTSMEMAQSGMFPFNVQESSSSGLDLAAKTAAFPEAYLDSLSTLSQIQQMSTGLDNDWQSLYSAGFHQG